MGVRILHDRNNEQAAIYCSTAGWAFGPIFTQTDDRDASEEAEKFLQWLNVKTHKDPRTFKDSELEQKYSQWLSAPDQYNYPEKNEENDNETE